MKVELVTDKDVRRMRQENRDKQEKIRGAGTLEELAKAMGVKLR